MKNLIIVILFVLSADSVCFSQSLASNMCDNHKDDEPEIIVDLGIQYYCNTGIGSALAVQTLLKDGEYFFVIKGVKSVCFFTNDGTNKVKKYWFSAASGKQDVEVSEKEIKRIIKKEKSEGISFNAVDWNGKYKFNLIYNSPFGSL